MFQQHKYMNLNIVNEYTKPNPQNYYGLSRLINENLFLYYFNKENTINYLKTSNIVSDAKFDKKIQIDFCQINYVTFLRNNHFKLKSFGKNIKNFLSMNELL